MQHPTYRPIGWTRNGRPVWPIAGGSDDPAPDPNPEPEPEPTDPPADPEPDPTPDPEPSDPEPDPEPEPSDDPDADELGPKGQKALDALKRERKQLKRERDKVRADLDAATKRLAEIEQANMSEQEKAVAEAEKRGREAAVTEQRDRMVRTLVKAQATGKLADPDDALRFLDVDDLDPDDDDGIADAVTGLIDEKPYLAVPEPAKPKPKPDPSTLGAKRDLDKPEQDPGSMSMDEYREWKAKRAKARAGA